MIRFAGGMYTFRDLPRLLLRSTRLPSQSYDVVHAIDWPHLLAFSALQKLKAFRFMTTVHGTEILQLRSSRQARLLAVRDPFHAPERIVCISNFTRSLLLERFPATDPARIEVVYLGVDPTWFRKSSAADSDAVRSRRGIAPDARVILSVSRLVPRKGHRLLLDAVNRIPDEVRRNLVVVIVGQGDRDYVSDLKGRAASCGARVVLTGGVNDDELRHLYGVADLFCLPGEADSLRVEGFGLVFLEAAAQRLPVVACRLGAVPEVVRDGETGLLVPPADPGALAAALRTLLERQEKSRELGEKAQLWARTFTWERCARLTYGT
jgi:phosphatidylinositol alpha-1,6-mannosyltransferase